MNKQQILGAMLDAGIVAVVRTSSAASAIQSIEAITRGGIIVAEVTMTVPGALQALEKIADSLGDKIKIGRAHV